MYSIDACMVCGEKNRTIVAEYNRLIFVESMWQSDLARFDYALCHGCGLVYATRRPDRTEYEFLYDRFNEFLVRKDHKFAFNVPSLTPELRQRIDGQFVPWWEVRSAVVKKSPIRNRLRHELASALEYLPYITLHMPLEGAKVLQIRAKGGTLADYLKRVNGAAQVDLMTLFPTHSYLAEKTGGIRARSCLDYEDFEIPFDEKYDLIIENHVLIHMLDPNKTFEVFTTHLRRGGAIFLQKELDDELLFKNGRNLFAELRPFHYHQFDLPTLQRLLQRYGFEPVFFESKEDKEKSELFGMVRQTHEPGSCPRISAKELTARLRMYARWRDESILSLPKERCRALFGDELAQVWKRVRASDAAKRPCDNGKPAGLRAFGDANVATNQLEIIHAENARRHAEKVRRHAEKVRRQTQRLNSFRTRFSIWMSDRLRGTRLADHLAKLPLPRVAEWLAARVKGQ